MTPDGVHVHDTGGPGTPVLFLHGLGGSAESWRPQLDALAADRRCVAWTMPGYGPSARLPEMTIETLAGAAADLLTALGADRAHVVGHSLGGYVAQELALSAPERVDRLVLVATTAAFGKPGSTFNVEFLAARLRPLDQGRTPADIAPIVVDGLVAGTASATVRAAAVASMSQISADAYRQALHALVAWDARHRVGAIDAATLCIAADADATAPVRAVERLQQLIPGATLEVVVGSGHLVNLERPAEFTDLLRRFLHPSSAGPDRRRRASQGRTP
ncbi:MAG: alpha/beta hydrolase [Acidimicrobiia bacterium]|nr:alpha/beta hydrolase [Acidimicrobiia bacterium]